MSVEQQEFVIKYICTLFYLTNWRDIYVLDVSTPVLAVCFFKQKKADINQTQNKTHKPAENADEKKMLPFRLAACLAAT